MPEHDQLYESLISTTRVLLLDHGGNLKPLMHLTAAEDQLKAGKPTPEVTRQNAEHIVEGLLSVAESIGKQRKTSSRISGRNDALELDMKFIRSAMDFFIDQRNDGWAIPSLLALENQVARLNTPQSAKPPSATRVKEDPRQLRRSWSQSDAMHQWEMSREDDAYLKQVEREARMARLEREIPQLAAQIGGRALE